MYNLLVVLISLQQVVLDIKHAIKVAEIITMINKLFNLENKVTKKVLELLQFYKLSAQVKSQSIGSQLMLKRLANTIQLS